MNKHCGDPEQHDPHGHDDLEWCDGEPLTGPLESRLLSDLEEAERANMHARDCQVCDALPQMSESARAATKRALAGTIGERKLADILTRSGYVVGRRAVHNHRTEGHAS